MSDRDPGDEQRERSLEETIAAGECARWLHVFADDSRPCSCGEFSSSEALREHNRRVGSR